MKKKKPELYVATTNAMGVLGRKNLRKQQNSAFLFQDLDVPPSHVCSSSAENQNKALYEQSFDVQLRTSQYQGQYQYMNRSYSNFI